MGQIYRSVIRIDIESIEGDYWSEDDMVSIKMKTDTFNITKVMTKKGVTGFDISTTGGRGCRVKLIELLRTYPVGGMNMHHTAEDIRKNIRHRILNDSTSIYFKPTTKKIYDSYKKVQQDIQDLLKFIQPHPKQRLSAG